MLRVLKYGLIFFIVLWLLLWQQSTHPSRYEKVTVHCHKDTAQWKSDHAFELMSWDLSGVYTHKNRITSVFSVLTDYILESSSTPPVIFLQNIPVQQLRPITDYLSQRYPHSCWAATYRWKTPTVNFAIHKWLSYLNTPEVYSSIILTWSPYRFKQAERWSLPPVSARWPFRWFTQLPTALHVTLSATEPSSDVQLINVAFARSKTKHQGMIRSVKTLKRQAQRGVPKNRQRVWGGALYTQVDIHNEHPVIGYQFAYLKLEDLYQIKQSTLSHPSYNWSICHSNELKINHHMKSCVPSLPTLKIQHIFGERIQIKELALKTGTQNKLWWSTHPFAPNYFEQHMPVYFMIQN